MPVLKHIWALKQWEKGKLIPEWFVVGKNADITDRLIDTYAHKYSPALFGDDMLELSDNNKENIKNIIEEKIIDDTKIPKDLQKLALFLDNIMTDPQQPTTPKEKVENFKTIATEYIQILRDQRTGDKINQSEEKKQEMMIKFQAFIWSMVNINFDNTMQKIQTQSKLDNRNTFINLVNYHKNDKSFVEKHTSAAILADFWFKTKEFDHKSGISKNESTGKITIEKDTITLINGQSKKMNVKLILDKIALYHIIFRHIKGINTFRSPQGDYFNDDNISDINDALNQVDKILSVIITWYTNMNDM